MDENPRPGLFEELKRRKVFRVAAAYAATAFIVLQVADLLSTGLALPVWVFRTITVLAIVGFPLAVVLAWAYELTPEGVRRTEASAGGWALASPRLRIAGVGLLAAITLGGVGWVAFRAVNGSDAAVRTLAVLPFESITADDGHGYIASGMRAEIMSQLSKMSEIRLLSPASIAAVGDSPDRLTRLVGELGVGSVLEGSVRVAGDRVRVSIQLTDARSGRAIWSEQYDRVATDVLAVQADVALRIAGALQARLTRQERLRVQALPTSNPAAYDLYLRGLEVGGGSRDRLIAAGELFRQAIRLDPGFALAHARLARTYDFLAMQGDPTALDSGMVHVQRALALDPAEANAHWVLGGLLTESGRMVEATHAYARALALDPNSTSAMNDLSVALALGGRFDESLHWAEQALRRGPNLVINHYHVGVALLYVGDDEVTERFLREALTMQPEGFHRIHALLAQLEVQHGRPDAAMERMASEARLKPNSFEVRRFHSETASIARAPVADSLLEALFHSHADARGTLHTVRTRYAGVLLQRGETERAHPLLDESFGNVTRSIEAGHELPHLHVELAAVHALRGDRDAALASLQRAYESGFRAYRDLAVDPLMDPVRDAPQFRQLLAKMESDVARMRQRAAAASELL